MKPLARALAALKKNADPLDALLDAWAGVPGPSSELADLIERAGLIVRTDPEGIRGKTKNAKAAWTKLARAVKPADVPALLESLCDVLWRDAYARLYLMRKWRPDPRVDDALVGVLESLPYRSTSKPFYTELIAQLARVREPLLVERIQAAEAEILRLMSPTLGEWLQRRVRELIAELEPTKSKPVNVSELRALLDRRAQATAPREELEDLLDSIYERPDDTARRLVYADALLERGDVRGELITLQCQDTLTPAQKKREGALLKAHGVAWLGELAPILSKEWRFERGFLYSCRVNSNKGTRIRPLIGHPAWSTVHTLADSAQIALHPRMQALRWLEFRPNRARGREEYPDAWSELLAGRERPIERLYYTDLDMYVSDDEQIELLGRCTALPKLRELFLGGLACFRADALYAAPIASRIEAFGFFFERENVALELFGSAMQSSKIKKVLVLHDEFRLLLQRNTDGPITHAHFEIYSERWFQAQQVLNALPATLRELRIRTIEERSSAIGIIALINAAKAFKSLEVREIGPYVDPA